MRRRAFTLVEVTISVLLVGVVLVASLGTLGASARLRRARADGTLGAALAQELLGEILAVAYDDPDGATGFGPDDGEEDGTRRHFDDVDDYHGWSATPPESPDGAVRDDLAGWARKVRVIRVDPATLEARDDDTGLLRIEVTVTGPRRIGGARSGLRSRLGPQEQAPVFDADVVERVDVELRLGAGGELVTTSANVWTQARVE